MKIKKFKPQIHTGVVHKFQDENGWTCIYRYKNRTVGIATHRTIGEATLKAKEKAEEKYMSERAEFHAVQASLELAKKQIRLFI